ncbi:MAG: ATP-binding cassette domain-containing protein, partial [Proteobacteria bacterium]|nr:ATP-binding cassette domain-containing protein [Pseudomonadota bacterium]
MPARKQILPLVFDKVSYVAKGARLVDEFSVTLDPGTRTIILGPNGAGKSLVLRLSHGLLQPTSGAIRWEGPGGGNRPALHQAMVFQRPMTLRRSVAANLDYVLSLRKVPRELRRAKTAEALKRAGLFAMRSRPARVLSAGEQQKLALGRAWVMEPEVLFLDEPTASLDPAATREVENMINAIHQAGTKIIMTTH